MPKRRGGRGAYARRFKSMDLDASHALSCGLAKSDEVGAVSLLTRHGFGGSLVGTGGGGVPRMTRVYMNRRAHARGRELG